MLDDRSVQAFADAFGVPAAMLRQAAERIAACSGVMPEESLAYVVDALRQDAAELSRLCAVTEKNTLMTTKFRGSSCVNAKEAQKRPFEGRPDA